MLVAGRVRISTLRQRTNIEYNNTTKETIKESITCSRSGRASARAGRGPRSAPPREHRRLPRDLDRDLYKTRHLIENFFAKLKQFRAIATRYDKTARNFLAAIHLAAAAIWPN